MNLQGVCRLNNGELVAIHKHDSASGRRYHSAFDVWDESGNHMGTYTLNGTQVEPPQASKNITKRLDGLVKK